MANKPVILIADDDERLLSALSIRLGSEFEVVAATISKPFEASELMQNVRLILPGPACTV